MKIEVKEISELGREINFEIEEEIVNREKERIIKELKKNVEVEGFRKGKVPERIIELRFSSLIKENLLKRIIPDAYLKAIKENNLHPAVDPEIREVKFDDGKLFLKIYTEIKPEFEIKKYKNLVLKKVKPEEITEEKVENTLKEWERRPEFAASIVDPEKRRLWRKKIREQLEYIAKREATLKEEEQLWKQLLQQVEFPVPEKLVYERARRYTEEHLRRMDLKGKTDSEIEKLANEYFEKFKPIARQDLKKYFILDKIAEKENIIPDEKEVEERIMHLSRITGKPLDEIKKNLERTGKIEDLKEEIRIKKAFDFVKENAQVIERVVLPGEVRGEGK